MGGAREAQVQEADSEMTVGKDVEREPVVSVEEVGVVDSGGCTGEVDVRPINERDASGQTVLDAVLLGQLLPLPGRRLPHVLLLKRNESAENTIGPENHSSFCNACQSRTCSTGQRKPDRRQLVRNLSLLTCHPKSFRNVKDPRARPRVFQPP